MTIVSNIVHMIALDLLQRESLVGGSVATVAVRAAASVQRPTAPHVADFEPSGIHWLAGCCGSVHERCPVLTKLGAHKGSNPCVHQLGKSPVRCVPMPALDPTQLSARHCLGSYCVHAAEWFAMLRNSSHGEAGGSIAHILVLKKNSQDKRPIIAQLC